jgi:hypothetical protein
LTAADPKIAAAVVAMTTGAALTTTGAADTIYKPIKKHTFYTKN